MISVSREAGIPAATNAPTIDPADVPATLGKECPASSNTEIAPTWAMPKSPPPSSTRSAASDDD